MKLLKLIPVFLIPVLIVSLAFGKENPSLIGKYVSRRPTKGEIIKMMYLKGHFKSVYSTPDEHVLLLEKDSTFTYTVKYCKIGNKTRKGKWSYEKNRLELNFLDTLNNLKFKHGSDYFYNTTDFMALKDSTKMKCLTILQKK